MSDNKPTVLVRVDANRQMGIGHAMRCLAVSEQFIARGYRVIFAMHEVPSALLARFDTSGILVFLLNERDNSADAFTRIAVEQNAAFVLIDGYHLENHYERLLKKTSAKILRFDDFMNGERCDADVVVNASTHAEVSQYTVWAPGAALLLGPCHIAFRSDMIAARQALSAKKAAASENSHINGNASILINFGGSDHLDMTIRTASAIANMLPKARIEVVTGAAYPQPERLQKLGINNLVHHHNTDNLAEIMQRARMAISAGGLTVSELALFGIPTILAITAQNQVKGAHVSWCHTILPGEDEENIDTDDMLKKILYETERLWRLPAERNLITDRIPSEIDTFGANRITEALLARI